MSDPTSQPVAPVAKLPPSISSPVNAPNDLGALDASAGADRSSESSLHGYTKPLKRVSFEGGSLCKALAIRLKNRDSTDLRRARFKNPDAGERSALDHLHLTASTQRLAQLRIDLSPDDLSAGEGPTGQDSPGGNNGDATAAEGGEEDRARSGSLSSNTLMRASSDCSWEMRRVALLGGQMGTPRAADARSRLQNVFTDSLEAGSGDFISEEAQDEMADDEGADEGEASTAS